jgi:acetyltransferase-like isoleucine patch superfamily enzyme
MSHQFSDTGAFNYIDSSATIGKGTRVWHFTIILADVIVGEDCNIGSRVEIGHGCKIGNRVRISSGVFLPPNSIVEDDVFLAPGVLASDDRYPRANNPSYFAEPPHFEKGCSVGIGSVILPGVHIGAGALVGAGSVVTRDVPAKGHVRGEPAREKAYSGIHREEFHELAAPAMIEHFKKTGKRILPS